MDSLTESLLSVDRLPAEDAQLLQTWLTLIANAVGARLLVGDDADPFKTVADQLGLDQQVCEAHPYLRWGRCVVRNTDSLVESLTPAAERDAGQPLAALSVTPAQAAKDVQRLGELAHSRQPEHAAALA